MSTIIDTNNLAIGIRIACEEIREQVTDLTVLRGKLLQLLERKDLHAALREPIKRIVVAPISCADFGDIMDDADHLSSSVTLLIRKFAQDQEQGVVI